MTSPEKSKKILYSQETAVVFSHDDSVETIYREDAPEDRINCVTSVDRVWFTGTGKFKDSPPELLEIGFKNLKAQM